MTQFLAWKACMHLYFVLRIDRKIQLFLSKSWATWPSTIYWILLIFSPVSLCFPSLIFLTSLLGPRDAAVYPCRDAMFFKLKWIIKYVWNPEGWHYDWPGFLSQNLIMMILECLVFREALWPYDEVPNNTCYNFDWCYIEIKINFGSLVCWDVICNNNKTW